MSHSTIQDIILKEANELPPSALKKVLDYIMLLKQKTKTSPKETIYADLSSFNDHELNHLEEEFKDYKVKFPHDW